MYKNVHLTPRDINIAICCASILSAHKAKNRARCAATKQAEALRIYRAECALASFFN